MDGIARGRESDFGRSGTAGRGGARLRAAWIAAVLLAAAACRSQTIPSTSLEQPVPIAVQGTYVHEPSGAAFPAKAAEFDRVGVARYDEEGNNVGVTYRRLWLGREGACAAVVSLFVYPAHPVSFEVQYDDELAETRHGKSEFREVRRVDSTAQHRGVAVTVRTTEFLSRGDQSWGFLPVGDLLVAFRHEPWHLACRVTFSALTRDECITAVERLLADLGLPSTGLHVGEDLIWR